MGYADTFREQLPISMAASDQFLSALRDDDELLEVAGRAAAETFEAAMGLRDIGGSYVQVISLLHGSLVAVVNRAFGIDD